MATEKDSAAIVRALISLGEGLGLEVAAEGLETLEQQQLLIEHGCGQAQGFFTAKQCPLSRLKPLMAEDRRRYGQ